MAHLARVPRRAGAPPLLFLIAHQTRSRASDALFMRELDAAGFTVTSLPASSLHPRFRDPAIAVLRIVQRDAVPGVPSATDAAAASAAP